MPAISHITYHISHIRVSQAADKQSHVAVEATSIHPGRRGHIRTWSRSVLTVRVGKTHPFSKPGVLQIIDYFGSCYYIFRIDLFVV